MILIVKDETNVVDNKIKVVMCLCRRVVRLPLNPQNTTIFQLRQI
jgi:hypothetical protein